jgi:hypothetical protein
MDAHARMRRNPARRCSLWYDAPRFSGG